MQMALGFALIVAVVLLARWLVRGAASLIQIVYSEESPRAAGVWTVLILLGTTAGFLWGLHSLTWIAGGFAASLQ